MIFDGLMEEQKIILQFEEKQLFIKLNNAISHSWSEDIKSTSSMHIRLSWSKDSIKPDPYCFTSFIGTYKDGFSFKAKWLHADWSKNDFPVCSTPYRNRSSSLNNISLIAKLFLSK